MAYLFSGFLWTYVICLIPLGLLVERIGAKQMVGGGIAIWSAATALPAATTGLVSIFAARLVMGASEATTFPACGRVIRDWFPERERGLVTTLFNGGSSAGPALGAIIVAALVSAFDWRTAFVVLGLIGFVWLAFWWKWYGGPDKVSLLADGSAPADSGFPTFRHSVFGMHVCLTVGLPDEVAHIAVGHSFEGQHMGVSAECMIVRQADHGWWHVAAALGLVKPDTMAGLAASPTARHPAA